MLNVRLWRYCLSGMSSLILALPVSLGADFHLLMDATEKLGGLAWHRRRARDFHAPASAAGLMDQG